ncbi:MAG: bifunctional DNA-formamidopyrimidine glycosylase/DNA-(apurinic or apyrimidinic site) lyase, partial [Myxococcota bacterium]|nr:bifunctional DNA-formamidopyrimidine glycosylase/DNA-(apurinic or apyrimidinic site) lyase [Myxococcota bacterium]
MIPELPEVETVRSHLAGWLPGRTIRSARLADAQGPKYVNLERAAGQRIHSVERRGKYLVLPLSGGDELIVHLGMTGRIRATAPDGHLRVVVELDGPAPSTLYFEDTRRFGRFLVAPDGDRSAVPTLAKMGPEPLEPEFTVACLARGLQSRGSIKPLLHSQRAVAGLGNIYIDEALWRARIHPLQPAHRVSRQKVGRLHEAIVEILSAAVERGGTTLQDFRDVEGRSGGYGADLQVYGRAGESCTRCDAVLRRLLVAQRGTTFCPRCQA